MGWAASLSISGSCHAATTCPADARDMLVPIAKARRDALRLDEIEKMTEFNVMMADIRN